MASAGAATKAPPPDGAAWLDALRDAGPNGDLALFRLRALLVTVAWYELERRQAQLGTLSTAAAARLVRDCADAACAVLVRRLDDYHGQSRFPVWAAKFAIREAAAAARGAAAIAGKNAAARDTYRRTDPGSAEGGAA